MMFRWNVHVLESVWQGFWYIRQQCVETHSLTKWPGLRQFRHNLLNFRSDMIWSCGMDLNLWQPCKGCLPLLHTKQWSLTVVVSDVTGLEIRLCLGVRASNQYFFASLSAEDSEAWGRKLMNSKQGTKAGHTSTILAMFLPLKHSSVIKFQL